jgi:hypothetical protein
MAGGGVRGGKEAGADDEGTFPTVFDAANGMRAISGLEAVGVVAFPRYCFKNQAAPTTNNANPNSPRTNFSLIFRFRTSPDYQQIHSRQLSPA